MPVLGRLPVIAALAASISAAGAQPPRFGVETVAGSGRAGAFSGPGAASELAVDQPFGVECGPDGALYITAVGSHRVLRLDRTSGELESVAGRGERGYAGDGGQARDALLNEPYEVRFDAQGHYMYFVEMKNHLVRKVDLHTGVIDTLAGDPQAGFAGDGGPARAARFRDPHSIALDGCGNLYVADIGNHRIRRIDTRDETVTTIAGTGEGKLPQSGLPAAGQPMFGPRALAVVERTLWIALREGNSVWKLDLDTGRIEHVAGSGESGYSGDGGRPADARFNGPKGIAATADGQLYVVDTENQVIRWIDTRGKRIATIAGGGPQARGFAGAGGSALSAQFDRPHGVCVAPDGSVYVGDTNNHRVRRLRPIEQTEP